MQWSPLRVIEQAFAEIGLAAHTYDLQPEQLASALEVLRSMVAEWADRKVHVGYDLTAPLNGDSRLSDANAGRVYLLLAARLAPRFGKLLSPAAIGAVNNAWTSLVSNALRPVESQLPRGYPLGAGSGGRVATGRDANRLQTSAGGDVEAAQ